MAALINTTVPSISTKEELNHIALNKGGVVDWISGGYDRRYPTPDDCWGYGFSWIGTHGVGNQGILVLVPKSREAKEYLRQGKINLLMKEYGLDYHTAESFQLAREGYRHAYEGAVERYCIHNMDNWCAWNSTPELCIWSTREHWQSEYNMPAANDMSCERMEVVWDIMKEWVKREMK